MRIQPPTKLVQLLDQSGQINGQPFDPNSEIHTPVGKYSCVHYGIMIPNLPAPYHFLNMIVVVGQPKVKLFRNEHLMKTSAIDTANLLIGTAATKTNLFKGYSVQKDCLLASNGHYLKFADDLVIEGAYPNFRATRKDAALNYDLKLKASDKIAHFAKLTGGLYEHWALLCEYEGYLELDGKKTELQGLCTFEYARAANVNLPFRFFTYQILNIDAKTQVLFVDVAGPLGLTVQSRVYVRSLDNHGGIYEAGFRSEVHEYEAQPVTTPNGIKMRLPKQFSWQVDDEHGNVLIRIQGQSNQDFKYGMAGGYAGSYQYQGIFKNKVIQGTGYIEYIDPV